MEAIDIAWQGNAAAVDFTKIFLTFIGLILGLRTSKVPYPNT